MLTLSHNGRNVPLEVSVLNHVRESGRIFQFRSRCVFTTTAGHPACQKHAARGCRALRPHSATTAPLLAEGADARLRAIETEMLAARRGLVSSALPACIRPWTVCRPTTSATGSELTVVMIDFRSNGQGPSLGLMERQESSEPWPISTRLVGTQDALEIVGHLEALAEDLKVLLKVPRKALCAPPCRSGRSRQSSGGSAGSRCPAR